MITRTQRKGNIMHGRGPISSLCIRSHNSSLINHREVGVHTEVLRSALRGALREIRDIILVGECANWKPRAGAHRRGRRVTVCSARCTRERAQGHRQCHRRFSREPAEQIRAGPFPNR